jgi:molybdopterin converting factor small subunit
MMDITIRYLGGLRQEMEADDSCLSLPGNATVADLEMHLRALGLDLDENKNIAVLNQRGLNQWPPDLRLAPGDVVLVFPNIAGG